MSESLKELLEKALSPRMIITETLEHWTTLSKARREFAAMEIIDALQSGGYEVTPIPFSATRRDDEPDLNFPDD
jgi:hypothetical protein